MPGAFCAKACEANDKIAMTLKKNVAFKDFNNVGFGRFILCKFLFLDFLGERI
jgi:hypothetical protein